MATLVASKSYKLSSVPLPKSVFINTQTAICDTICMNEFLKNGQIFSFLSRYETLFDELYIMQSDFDYYKKIFRISDRVEFLARVAMLVPQKSIRRYASTTVNSVLSYLLLKQSSFELKIFNSNTENYESILSELKKIKDDNFKYVIAPVTKIGAEVIVENSKGLSIYIPTVHRNKAETNLKNIIFGGIDYDKQIDELLKYANDKVAYFSERSSLSRSLSNSLIKKNQSIIFNKNINNSRINFKKIFKKNHKLQNSSIFINTPLIKTSLISSQLRVYNVKPYVLLSTQINYNPMLLSLTQYEDRKDMFIANSIGVSEIRIREVNSLLWHDIVYDWVNYSTSVGIDYFYSNYFIPSSNRVFSEHVSGGQVNYDVVIMSPKRYKFEKEIL